MKITNTTYTCDVYGADMPHPAFVKPTECGDYTETKDRYTIWLKARGE